MSRRKTQVKEGNTQPDDDMQVIAHNGSFVSNQAQTSTVATVNHKKKDKEKPQKEVKKKPQTQREKKPTCSERFDGSNHWPEYDDPNEARKGFRCKLCGVQTDVYCSKCNVHLCFVKEKTKKGETERKIRNCFKAFHNLDES